MKYLVCILLTFISLGSIQAQKRDTSYGVSIGKIMSSALYEKGGVLIDSSDNQGNVYVINKKRVPSKGLFIDTMLIRTDWEVIYQIRVIKDRKEILTANIFTHKKRPTMHPDIYYDKKYRLK